MSIAFKEGKALLIFVKGTSVGRIFLGKLFKEHQSHYYGNRLWWPWKITCVHLLQDLRNFEASLSQVPNLLRMVLLMSFWGQTSLNVHNVNQYNSLNPGEIFLSSINCVLIVCLKLKYIIHFLKPRI